MALQHSDDEVEGGVRVAHNEEQRRFPVVRVSSSSSSSDMISCSSAISKAARRAQQLMRMDFRVLTETNCQGHLNHFTFGCTEDIIYLHF